MAASRGTQMTASCTLAKIASELAIVEEASAKNSTGRASKKRVALIAGASRPAQSAIASGESFGRVGSHKRIRSAPASKKALTTCVETDAASSFTVSGMFSSSDLQPNVAQEI